MKKLLLALLICSLTIPLYAALTKQVVVDKIEILEDGQIQIREVTRVLEDGVEIGHTYRRHCLDVASNTTQETAKVQAIANATWTPEVIAERAKVKKAKVK